MIVRFLSGITLAALAARFASRLCQHGSFASKCTISMPQPVPLQNDRDLSTRHGIM